MNENKFFIMFPAEMTECLHVRLLPEEYGHHIPTLVTSLSSPGVHLFMSKSSTIMHTKPTIKIVAKNFFSQSTQLCTW
jgi:hypothetical protein